MRLGRSTRMRAGSWQRAIASICLIWAVGPTGHTPEGLAAESTTTLATTGGASVHQRDKSDDFGLPQVRLINTAIRQGWADHGFVPSQPATDGEWCRRVYLDLIGRLPTVD